MEPSAQTARAHGPLRVLVADDDRGAREALRELLVDEGFEVACASDGTAALAAIDSFGPDVVVSDVRMPRMSGLDLLRAIRAGGHGSPRMILVSADTQACAAANAPCLAKPISYLDLLAMLRNIPEGASACPGSPTYSP